MNFIQFGLFIVYVFSTYVLGLYAYTTLNKSNESFFNRWVFLGEVLLLGSIFIVGELLALSIGGLYKAFYLWATIVLNFSVLGSGNFRQRVRKLFVGFKMSVVDIIFITSLILFFVRNCYFMVDVDSHSDYLWAQKVFLEHGTSIWADRGVDWRIHVVQFDCMPYSLGLSIFPRETLFPQLVNWFWRLIVLVLIFGYTRYRFNGLYALAASMLILLNDHFFFSGENQWVLINGAVVAFLFAVVMNIWESYRQDNVFRLFLAIIFLSQVIINKLQMAYLVFFFIILIFLLHKNAFKKIREILANRLWCGMILLAVFLTSLWFIKNYLATGVITFPLLAGKYQVLGWTQDMETAFAKIYRGASPQEFFKYVSYFFVWPGILAEKIVWLMIMAFPFLMFILLRGKSLEKESTREFCFWLSLSFTLVMLQCFISYQDPRFFRYIITVFVFTMIFGVDYILKNIFSIKNTTLIGLVLLGLALSGYKTVTFSHGTFNYPSLRDNWLVLTDHLHADDIIKIHYPENLIAEEGLVQNPDKGRKGAWYLSHTKTTMSRFWLTDRPYVGFWFTTIVGWGSYDREDLIIKDIKDFGIEWIMMVKDQKLMFLSPEEYAKTAILFDRKSKKIAYSYDTFPEELRKSRF